MISIKSVFCGCLVLLTAILFKNIFPKGIFTEIASKMSTVELATSDPKSILTRKITFMAIVPDAPQRTEDHIFNSLPKDGMFKITFDMDTNSTELITIGGSSNLHLKKRGNFHDFYLGRNIRFEEYIFTLNGYADKESEDAIKHWRKSTFAMIKPDAMPVLGEVLNEIRKEMHVADMKMVQLSTQQAEHFYSEHKERPFFNDLVDYVTEGSVLALKLQNTSSAVNAWRKKLGPTNSIVAKKENPNSIRALFGTDKTRNAAHGSDSEESAERELSLFFPHSGSEIPSLSLSARHNMYSKTSLIILPHIVQSSTNLLGDVLKSMIEDHECDISALEMIHIDYLEAKRLATGKIFPVSAEGLEFQRKVLSLIEGPSIIVNLSPILPERESDLLKRFPDILGPHDPRRARMSAIESLRATFGVDNFQNGVISPYFDYN